MPTKEYIIFKTAGGAITIAPDGINGSNVLTAEADINLVGQGTTVFGKSTNESIYRMTESFNCPEKAGTPGTPQDEADLGTGLGINNPIDGQLWFNSDTDKLMVYSGAAFKSTGGVFSSITAPTAPFEGDLWYDTNIPQLKVYNGAAFDSTALLYLLLDGTAAMTGDLDAGGNDIVNVADTPLGGQYAANKNYVDGEITTLTNALTGGLLDPQYVEIPGDTMTGSLTLNGNLLNFSAMTLNAGNGSITIGPDIRMTSAALLSCATDFNINVDNDNNGTGSFVVNKGADVVDGSETALFTVENDGTLNVAGTTNYENLVTADDDIPNKKYVDDLASSSTPTGTVSPFAATTVPTGYLLCNGQAVSRATFADLFALLDADGLLFGNGDGSTTFNVPDYRGRSPMGVGTSTGTTGGSNSVTLAEAKGSWKSLIAITNMPAHDHGGGDHVHTTGRANFGFGTGGQQRAANAEFNGVVTSNLSGDVITSEGGGTTFDTFSMVLGINFIIKT